MKRSGEIKGAGFLRGVFAMGAALALIFGADAFLRAVPYPPARLAALVVKAVPGGFATEMIERLGHGALQGLVIGIHVASLVFGGLAAVLIRSDVSPTGRARRGLAFGSILFAIAFLLGLTAPEGMSLSAVVLFLGVAYGCARLISGEGIAAALQPQVRGAETPLDAVRRSRRRFIVRGAAAMGGFVIGGAATLRFLAGKLPMDVEITAADLPFVQPPADPDFPEVVGLSSEITANHEFYTVDINFLKPNIDHSAWTLRIQGEVDAPYTLDYPHLQHDFEVIEMAHTLTCISNEVGGDLISTAVWRGVRLKDVLDRAKMRGGIVDIVFRAAEGYSDSIPVTKALEETTLVVFGMNGVALPRDHGFPARIIVPGIYGMKNVKWLTEIEAVDHDYQGYWMVRGWSDVAGVKTQSRIDVPTRRERVTLPAKAAGIAWAGDRRVSRVEISEDGGASWRPALLKRELSPVAWRLWAADLSPGPGSRTLRVRATDGDGEVQEVRITAPHPEGASGLHSIPIES